MDAQYEVHHEPSGYQQFLAAKRRSAGAVGFNAAPIKVPAFDWQSHVIEWALRQGRAALFEDCGLGKTIQQLEWARQVSAHTNMPVIILAPLAVADQTVREGERFGVDVRYAQTPEQWDGCPIIITNYERLSAWVHDVHRFSGVVLDESSILKSFAGRTRNLIVQAFAQTPYRLACTATPSPNDFMELGNHAEFLGVCSSVEMLATWFINDLSDAGTWRLKKHSQRDFWRWVCSWAMCIGTPADIGFADDGYILPDLMEVPHVVTVDLLDGAQSTLFRMPAMSAMGMHEERRRTAPLRADALADVVGRECSDPWVIWCETDYEADAIRHRIKDAVEIRGSDSLDRKESTLRAFSCGDERVLITKPKIAGFGLNWQHCARTAFASATYSFESYYQSIRRMWRFGQARSVYAHVFMAQTESHVWDALNRKSSDHKKMQRAMFDAAREAQSITRVRDSYEPKTAAPIPAWIQGGMLDD